MSSKIPNVGGRQLLRAMLLAGIVETRTSGSHHFVRHPDGRATSIPVHGQRDVPTGTLMRILKDVRMTADDLRELI